MITKEQVLQCIKNFADLRYKVDIIRTYCIEKGKDEFFTEIFLQGLRDRNTKAQMEYLSGNIPLEPEDLFDKYAKYVINLKIRELNIIHLYSKSGKLLLVY